MTSSPASRRLKALGWKLREAVDHAKLAYGFVPNGYTYSCLSACLAAEQALEVLGQALVDLQPGEENT